MDGILFIDFNLKACIFRKFDWFEMLNSHITTVTTVVSRFFEHQIIQIPPLFKPFFGPLHLP